MNVNIFVKREGAQQTRVQTNALYNANVLGTFLNQATTLKPCNSRGVLEQRLLDRIEADAVAAP